MLVVAAHLKKGIEAGLFGGVLPLRVIINTSETWCLKWEVKHFWLLQVQSKTLHSPQAGVAASGECWRFPGGIVCVLYGETPVFPSGDLCIDAHYGCRNIFFGL